MSNMLTKTSSAVCNGVGKSCSKDAGNICSAKEKKEKKILK